MQFGDVHALGGRVSWGHVGHTEIVLSKIEFFTNLVTNLYNVASLKFFVCSQEKYCHAEALDAYCTLFGLT